MAHQEEECNSKNFLKDDGLCLLFEISLRDNLFEQIQTK